MKTILYISVGLTAIHIIFGILNIYSIVFFDKMLLGLNIDRFGIFMLVTFFLFIFSIGYTSFYLDNKR